MPCFHPLKALRSSEGVKILSGDSSLYNLLLPCGQCVGCRLERSRQWAIRIVHESKMHKANCFLTLTYDNEHCPPDFSLDYTHFQRFMKRLRKHLGFPVRFYMCGEYGDTNNRPHYHVCLFGFDFPDKVLWRPSKSGYPLYRSPTLERIWPFGFCTIGELTFETAAYTARYIMTKRTGARAKEYRVISEATGEVFERTPEFNRMSLKPGIGAGFFEKYGDTDIIPHDRVVHDGYESNIPRYYSKLIGKRSPIVLDMLKRQRVAAALLVASDNNPSRRAVKEVVFKARISSLKRSSF